MDSVVLLSFSVACSYESLNNLVFVFCGKSSSSFVPLICFAFSVNGQNRPACIKSSDQHKQWRITSDVHYISQHKDCITLHYVTLHYTFTIAIIHVIIKYGSCTTDLPQVCSQKSISQSVPEHVLSIFSLAKHGHLVDGSEHGGWLKRLLWPGMALTLTCCTASTPGVSKTLYWGTYPHL